MRETDHIQPELRSERLVLRHLRMSDAGFIRTHAGDLQVARNLAVVPHPYPDGAAEEFIARSLHPDTPEMVWLIEYGPAGHEIPAGVISLKPDEGNAAILGYWVAPWLWGFGFASEAVACLVDHARVAGFDRLRASVHEGNAASERVLAKSQFVKTGADEHVSRATGQMVAVGLFEVWLRQGGRK